LPDDIKHLLRRRRSLLRGETRVTRGNYGDGVDGAPTGIDVPRWSLSQSI
jgi:hypothetical protein